MTLQSSDILRAKNPQRVALNLKTITLGLLPVMGMSLFGFDLQPATLGITSAYVEGITISYADVTIGILLVYALFMVRRIKLNVISFATLLLAGILFLSGAVNSLADHAFDNGNFLANYARIVGIVGMVFLLPPLFTRIGSERLAWSTMWVVRLHCGVILFDSFALFPDILSPSDADISRPMGFFAEPGWFGIWIGLSVFYVLQVQRNFNKQYINLTDFGLIGISVIGSAGVRGVVLVAVALIVVLICMGTRARVRVMLGGLIATVAFLFTVQIFPDTGPAFGWGHVTSSAPGEVSFNDVRLQGSLRLSNLTWQRDSLIGTGLGESAHVKTVSRYTEVGTEDLPPLASKIMPTAVLRAGGVFALVVFLFIVFRMITLVETRWMGLGFACTAMVFGAAFESVIWWQIALAVGLAGTLRGRTIEVASQPEISPNSRADGHAS